MPSVAAVTPRKIFPPPITMAICTPALCTATISSAMLASVSASMPVRRPPISASPESLRRMRLYLGASAMAERKFIPSRSAARGPRTAALFHVRHDFAGEIVTSLLDPLAQFVADEARHGERTAGILAGSLQIVADALLVVSDV